MRVLLGMILGAFLTVGAAFLHDTWTTGPALSDPPSATVEQRAMVNWDVVGTNWRRVKQNVREAWTTLSHTINS